MTTTIVIIFCIVYIGMILGGLPFLQLDRTGVALLGAIALISVDAVNGAVGADAPRRLLRLADAKTRRPGFVAADAGCA